MNQKIVSDYANIPLFSVSELNCIIYEMLLFDATVYSWRQSEEGRELLKVLSRITIKEADVKAIRQEIK